MTTLSTLHPDLWPRNRLAYAGPSAISTAELLAILLGSGNNHASALETATMLMTQTGGLPDLARMSLHDLQQLANIGPAKAATIKAAFELSRRLATTSPRDMPILRKPSDIAELFMLEMSYLETEELRVVLVDTKNRFIGHKTVYIGNINTVYIRVAEVLREPIRRNAPAFALIHNHPSGDVSPSPEDVRTTELIREAAKQMDIDLLDHIIIGNSRFCSLKERGLGFTSPFSTV